MAQNDGASDATNQVAIRILEDLLQQFSSLTYPEGDNFRASKRQWEALLKRTQHLITKLFGAQCVYQDEFSLIDFGVPDNERAFVVMGKETWAGGQHEVSSLLARVKDELQLAQAVHQSKTPNINSPRITPYHFRVFIASPGDVREERTLAQQAIARMQERPVFRDRVTMRIIAWDRPNAGTPMLATMSPQAAINSGLARPSECDVVVVLFWSRMGTLLSDEYVKPDGSRYQSGTEWEYWDAFNAAQETGRPYLLVYRRTEEILLDADAPNFMEDQKQREQVNKFFSNFQNPDGSIQRGYNQYKTPDDFYTQFETHLETVIVELLKAEEERQVNDSTDERRTALYTILAELKDVRSKYIRFLRGNQQDDPNEHERIISIAQGVCIRASQFDEKPCLNSSSKMVIPSEARGEQLARYMELHNKCRNNLRYIADIWLTVNQVTRKNNYAEYELWGEYEQRNLDALDHAIKQIDVLINQPIHIPLDLKPSIRDLNHRTIRIRQRGVDGLANSKNPIIIPILLAAYDAEEKQELAEYIFKRLGEFNDDRVIQMAMDIYLMPLGDIILQAQYRNTAIRILQNWGANKAEVIAWAFDLMDKFTGMTTDCCLIFRHSAISVKKQVIQKLETRIRATKNNISVDVEGLQILGESSVIGFLEEILEQPDLLELDIRALKRAIELLSKPL